MHTDYLSLPGQPRCPQSGEPRTFCQCAACESWRAEERARIAANLARTDQAIRTAPIADRQLSTLYDEVCQLRRQLAERDQRIEELEREVCKDDCKAWLAIPTEIPSKCRDTEAGYCPD